MPRCCCVAFLPRRAACHRFILLKSDRTALTCTSMLAAADMNHIIHAATHPSWRLEPYADDQEMFREVEAYVDLIVSQVRRAAAAVAALRMRLHLKRSAALAL